MGAQPGEVAPVQRVPALVGAYEAARDVEECRLAGAVGSDDAVDAVGRDRQGGVGERHESAEGDGDVLEREHGGGLDLCRWCGCVPHGALLVRCDLYHPGWLAHRGHWSRRPEVLGPGAPRPRGGMVRVVLRVRT
ncbi:hypothetical protein GCM10007231_25240 [Nocardioides daphniae]|uniref:Uncharacterized protein n=1 Tax=Nocardioides daphniae TaxID=402297 RepID=A0ABQ1QF52_9ACTN|nr:hypothetical protein GCM10007231_25240 [Nocardioides daphniae]